MLSFARDVGAELKNPFLCELSLLVNCNEVLSSIQCTSPEAVCNKSPFTKPQPWQEQRILPGTTVDGALGLL